MTGSKVTVESRGPVNLLPKTVTIGNNGYQFSSSTQEPG